MKKNEKRRRLKKSITRVPKAGSDYSHMEIRGERGYSRPPLARMIRIHEWLMENRFPNCRKIAEEFEVSAKTVQRDINFMRDQMCLPIEYAKNRFGFHYTRPVTGFPAMSVANGKTKKTLLRQTPHPSMGEPPHLSGASQRGPLLVRIRFDAASARAVRRRIWHPTQVIHPLPGGGIEITIRPRDEWEIARWVLSWAGRASLIEPIRLRQQIRNLAREIAARH